MKENLLLEVIPGLERRRIEPYCETVQLQTRSTLIEADAPIEYVWFPHGGVLSHLIHVETGESVEVGLVGREGMAGLPLVLGGFANPFRVIVQAGGMATRIAREPFVHEVLREEHPFCKALLKYANLFLSNVAQTAACNRLHRIEQRLARWLLDMRVRVESDVLPVTHELLGLMVGAYRPSVTNALGALEARGVIRVGRGQITVLEPGALAEQACECHELVQQRTHQTLERIRSMAA